jgi:DNA end-binding protein Ku
MARAIWKGELSMGGLRAPVRLLPAVQEGRPRFRLLHEKDGAPVGQDPVCLREHLPIDASEVVRGFEYARGKYVLLTQDDLRAAAPQKRARSIEITEFVGGAEIDGRFLDTTYFLEPQTGGERLYALLREGLRRKGRVGLGWITLREAPRPVAIGVLGPALTLTTLRYESEVLEPASLALPEVAMDEHGLARVLSEIDRLTGLFQPGKYKDEYGENLQRVIQEKVQQALAPPAQEAPARRQVAS